ncbi:Rz1-like lysis system protein LysC [Serratia ureilytica]|uniref:Rz1-like lysis system protein LysC n=1 Tax=Serratia ureilytica TaxID=300181 RepID=UPI003D9DBA97
MKRLKTIPALVSLCLPLCLSSCARPPAQPPASLILLPPESVFTPCEQPEIAGDTWGDAVSYTLALQTSLKICAGRIATLNAWRAGLLEKTSEKK